MLDTNGHPPAAPVKGKKRNDAPIDPATMYESLKNRIAALEEEEVLEEEEERRFGRCRLNDAMPLRTNEILSVLQPKRHRNR